MREVFTIDPIDIKVVIRNSMLLTEVRARRKGKKVSVVEKTTKGIPAVLEVFSIWTVVVGTYI